MSKKEISERKRKSPKRLAVIEAATLEFLEKGYSETSMDKIAETAKVSKRTVYDHFPSKDDLFQAIVDEVLERVENMPEHIYSETESLDNQLYEIGLIFAKTITDEKFIKLSKVVLSHFIHSPEWAHNTVTAHKQTRKNMMRFFKETTKQGRMNIENAEFSAAQFCGLIKELIFWPELMAGKKSASQQEIEQVVRAATHVFLSYYAK